MDVVRLVSGFSPAAGSLFDVLVSGSLNGVFGDITGLDDGVVQLVAEQTPTRVRLTVV